MILAECHALLGPINPGNQISATWGMAPATDQSWDSTIRAHSGGTSQTSTLLLRSITNMHSGQGRAPVCRWPIHSLFFWLSPALSMLLWARQPDEMTPTLIKLAALAALVTCATQGQTWQWHLGEKGVRHPNLCVHIFNQCSHSNCLCNKLWPAAGVWYRLTNILLMDYSMWCRPGGTTLFIKVCEGFPK